MTDKNDLEHSIQRMIDRINKKDPPPISIAEKNKICKICAQYPESPKIVKKDIVKILTIKNGSCPSLKLHDIAQVEYIVRVKGKIVELMLAGYMLKIPGDCTVRKVCSSCGKPINS